MNKGTGIFIVIVLIIIGGVVYYFTAVKPSAPHENKAQGTVVVSVGDPSTQIAGVTEVKLSIDSVKLHNETDVWITVSNNDEEYPLLALDKERTMRLYTSDSVDVGSYDQIQVEIDSVTIVKSDGTEVKAILPSDTITLDGAVTVETDATSSIALNFKTSDSLHETSDGQFIFAPVVKMEARNNANIDVGNDDTVMAEGGTVTANTTSGVDIDGKTKVNFSIPSSTVLQIVNGTIEIENGPNGTSTMEEGIIDENASGTINSDIPSVASGTVGNVGGILDTQTSGAASF